MGRGNPGHRPGADSGGQPAQLPGRGRAGGYSGMHHAAAAVGRGQAVGMPVRYMIKGAEGLVYHKGWGVYGPCLRGWE